MGDISKKKKNLFPIATHYNCNEDENLLGTDGNVSFGLI